MNGERESHAARQALVAEELDLLLRASNSNSNSTTGISGFDTWCLAHSDLVLGVLTFLATSVLIALCIPCGLAPVQIVAWFLSEDKPQVPTVIKEAMYLTRGHALVDSVPGTSPSVPSDTGSIAMARCLALVALLAAASCVLIAVCPSEVHRVEMVEMPGDWVKNLEKTLGCTVMRMRDKSLAQHVPPFRVRGVVPNPHDPGNAVHRLGRVFCMLRHGVFSHDRHRSGRHVLSGSVPTLGVAFPKFSGHDRLCCSGHPSNSWNCWSHVHHAGAESAPPLECLRTEAHPELRNTASPNASPLSPLQAGATLEPTQLTFRQDFFLSLLILQLLTAWLLGMSLTFFARICPACRMSAQPSYAPIEPEVQFTFTLLDHLSFHAFFAGITCLGLMTDSFSVATGTSWELYVLFVGTQTASNVLEALYWAVHLPPDAVVPRFGWPVVSSVLPVLGEPLDTCKDYFFAGIALSTGTWQGLFFAAIAIGILVCSNIYLRNKHRHTLGRDLLAVRKACFPSKAEGILATQTSPTKLAIALSEDLPQAVLQSLFVLTCGGSPTQYAFIGLSIAKITCCLSLRAMALRQDDRHGEASAANIELYQMMIFALSFVVGPQHSWMLPWKILLARSLNEVGRHQEALAMYEEVLEVRRQVLGPRHPDTLTTQHCVAFSLGEVGRHQEALAMYEEVLGVRRQVSGPRHPDTLAAQSGVAFSLGEVGRHQEALAMYEEVLEVRRQDLGPRHPDTLTTQHCVAFRLGQAGQHQEALEMFQEVLEVRRQVLGPRHPDTLSTQHCVAFSLGEVGQHQEALAMYQEVLEVQRQVLGLRHPNTLTTQHCVAFRLGEVGQHQEALAMNEEVLEVRRQVLGPRHPDTLTAQHNMAFSLGAVGRHQEALAMCEEVLEAMQEVLGRGHPHTVLTEKLIAELSSR
eukprot:s4159_g1.t1